LVDLLQRNDSSGFSSIETDRSLAAARELVLRHGWNATCYQILNPGMSLWFSRAGDAVAGYGCYDRTWVVAGAPVCSAERLDGVVLELEGAAADAGKRLLFFGAGTRLERSYAARGPHAVALLGAQPTWNPREWNKIVSRKASLRAQLHRARNKGVLVCEWGSASHRAVASLRVVLHEWLATRGLPPLAYTVTPDLLDHLEDRRLFVAERGGKIQAFLIATPIPARGGWLVEQWPRIPSAPNGTTHALVDAAMRAFADSGSRYATLGLAPLSQHQSEPSLPQPIWLRFVLGWLRAHGRRFYNFEGLESFKTSLAPSSWEPVYAIAQDERLTPRTLRAIAGVFSGQAPELLVARAIGMALKHEWEALRS
jgi:phosphatidylglycerol lysyltransferase